MINNDDSPKQIPDNQDINLNSLWEQQSQISIDPAIIKKRAKQQTCKQRMYIAVDVLSLLPILMFLFVDFNWSPFLKVFFVVNVIGAVLTTCYIIKLRCLSAIGQSKNTQEYKNSLLKQLKNNAQIARINKHLCWIVVLAMSLLLLVNTWIEPWTLQQLISKGLLMLGVTIAILAPWYLWSSKRQLRFEQEASDLKSNQLFDNQNNDEGL